MMTLTQRTRTTSLVCVFALLSLTCPWSSTAFTATTTTSARRRVVTNINSNKRIWNPRKSSESMLLMMDPSSMLDTVIASTSHFLADAAADVAVAATDVDAVAVVSDAVAAVATEATDAVAVVAADVAADAAAAVEPVSYSQASYYTILGLYVLSFPGLYSTVKRSTKAKVKRQTFVSPGENASEGKGLRQQAGEIMAYMKANNYEVTDAGETIKFRGIVARSLSQAFFLVFCTALGMISLALVLQIQFQDLVLPVIGHPNWYLLSLLSPYAGLYYWQSGDRVDDFEVKLLANDDETQNEITVQGSEEELERMWRTLEWTQKGMVKVPGLLEE